MDDPVLVIRVAPTGDMLVVDCGRVDHIAKRVLKSVAGIFITHAHMDHFGGIDALTRALLTTGKSPELVGPAGIARRLWHKLQGYEWNLTEDFYMKYIVKEFLVREIGRFELAGAKGFSLEKLSATPRQNNICYESQYVKVEGAICDHRIPCLIYRFTEKPAFLVDPDQLAAGGFIAGDWLRELHIQYNQNRLGLAPLKVTRTLTNPGKNTGSETIEFEDTRTLYNQIRKEQIAPSLGYITDVGFTPDNLQKVYALLRGVNFLVCECSYLSENKSKARTTYHLCTADVNEILDELKPDYFLPFHFSKSYLGQSAKFYEEFILPAGTRLLKLPERRSNRPLQLEEVDYFSMSFFKK